jgi:hypothetical protein
MGLHCSLASISDFPHLGVLLSTRFPLDDAVVVVVVADVVVEVVVVVEGS